MMIIRIIKPSFAPTRHGVEKLKHIHDISYEIVQPEKIGGGLRWTINCEPVPDWLRPTSYENPLRNQFLGRFVYVLNDYDKLHDVAISTAADGRRTVSAWADESCSAATICNILEPELEVYIYSQNDPALGGNDV